MEQMKNTENTIDVFENDIDMYLKLYCEEHDIKDMKKESQGVWNSALMYIKRHVFSNPRDLKRTTPLNGYTNNNYSDNEHSKLNYSNCNAYDTDKLNAICDYYIFICYMYDKEVSIMGFSKLIGIPRETIQQWGRDDRKLSTASFSIYEKLSTEREESLSSKLVSNKNPVAIISILNKYYGWSLPGVTKEKQESKVPTLDQIRQEYGALPEKLPELPE